MASDFVNSTDLSDITGLPDSTFRYWEIRPEARPAGFPPSFKIGRRRVWRRAAVMAWLEAQERAATA